MIAPLRALAGAALFLLPAIGLLSGEGRAQGAAPGNVQFHEVQIAADAFSLGEAVPAWVIPTAIPEPGQAEPMLIRLADTQYYVDRAPIVYVRRAVTINDAASLSRAGQVSIPFVPQYHKLKVHAVRVLRGGETLDRTASSSVRFLQRETGLEQGIYSGEVTASILVNDLRVGDTLEYAYSLYGQNPVFGDKFIATASWDQGYPAALRRVVLTHPAGRQIAWRLIGDRKDAPLTPVESVHEGMRRLVFEERSIAKVLLEPMTPTEHVAFRRLQFSEFAGWSDVVGWADELFQSNGNLGEDGRAVVETLRQKATEEDRVVAALEFVQSQIRYFSVSMGESSHRPTQPEVVLKRRYGDCKDKSLLLVAMLQALGIPAKPVLVDLGRLGGSTASFRARSCSIMRSCKPRSAARSSISTRPRWGSMAACGAWGRSTRARRCWWCRRRPASSPSSPAPTSKISCAASCRRRRRSTSSTPTASSRASRPGTAWSPSGCASCRSGCRASSC